MFRKQAITGISLVALVLALSLNAFPRSSKAANSRVSPRQNELLALGDLKQLYQAEVTYFLQVNPGHFAGLTQLFQAGLINGWVASGQYHGYFFVYVFTSGTTGFPATFNLRATPAKYGKSGKRSFYMSDSCTIYAADKNGQAASPSDPVLETCSPTLALNFEQQAIIAMRAVHSAEATYAATTGNGNYGTQDQLIAAGLLSAPSGPMNNRAFWHQWTITPIPATATSGPTFKSFATPLYYREFGLRSLFVDQTGVIRGADRAGEQAHEDDPPIEN